MNNYYISFYLAILLLIQIIIIYFDKSRNRDISSNIIENNVDETFKIKDVNLTLDFVIIQLYNNDHISTTDEFINKLIFTMRNLTIALEIPEVIVILYDNEVNKEIELADAINNDLPSMRCDIVAMICCLKLHAEHRLHKNTAAVTAQDQREYAVSQ